MVCHRPPLYPHFTPCQLLPKIASISDPGVQTHQVSFWNKNSEGLYNSASSSPGKRGSVNVSGSDLSCCSSSHMEVSGRRERECKLHSNIAPHPQGRSMEAPPLWKVGAGDRPSLKRQKQWQCSFHSGPDSEVRFKWKTLTKSDFLRIITTVSKYLLFKFFTFHWMSATETSWKIEINEAKKKLMENIRLYKEEKLDSIELFGPWWLEHSWGPSSSIGKMNVNREKDLRKNQDLPGNTKHQLPLGGGRDTSILPEWVRGDGTSAFRDTKIHEVLFLSDICQSELWVIRRLKGKPWYMSPGCGRFCGSGEHVTITTLIDAIAWLSPLTTDWAFWALMELSKAKISG